MYTEQGTPVQYPNLHIQRTIVASCGLGTAALTLSVDQIGSQSVVILFNDHGDLFAPAEDPALEQEGNIPLQPIQPLHPGNPPQEYIPAYEPAIAGIDQVPASPIHVVVETPPPVPTQINPPRNRRPPPGHNDYIHFDRLAFAVESTEAVGNKISFTNAMKHQARLACSDERGVRLFD